jgi:AraC-like DNA-binding protein
VREYIREHFAATVSLEQLARIAGLSRYHVVRAFARAFGLPPHAYQKQVRLSKARSLLAAGMPIAAVAAETGFADQSHLTRQFHAEIRVTPARYGKGPGAYLPARLRR